MAPALTVDSFLDVIRRSRLVSSTDLQNALQALESEGVDVGSPKSLANALIDRGLLTRWQADYLLQGRHKGFFLGSYRFLEMLGKGGMGAVYLAEHQMMRRRCAIKVLPAKLIKSGSSVLERFYLEAQAVAALDHPNIVRAYDVNKETQGKNEVHYLVMEYVDGTDLQIRVKENGGGLDYVQVADFARQAASGIAHAHANGLIHRDIKPANLLVDGSGTVKILDLGLARFFDDKVEASLTTAYNESILGTADYLSPEQALNSHDVDTRTDIYSLGCTCYFMLTGQPPFPEGSVAQRLMSHQVKSPAPIEKFRPNVPADLVAIIDRMIAKKPEDRYQTADAVADVFRGWLLEHAGEAWKEQHRDVLGEGSSRVQRDEPTRARSSEGEDTEVELGLAPLDEDEPAAETAKPVKDQQVMPTAVDPTPVETLRGKASSPDSTSPDSTSPDSASPDSASPDSASPDSASPDSASSASQRTASSGNDLLSQPLDPLLTESLLTESLLTEPLQNLDDRQPTSVPQSDPLNHPLSDSGSFAAMGSGVDIANPTIGTGSGVYSNSSIRPKPQMSEQRQLLMLLLIGLSISVPLAIVVLILALAANRSGEIHPAIPSDSTIGHLPTEDADQGEASEQTSQTGASHETASADERVSGTFPAMGHADRPAHSEAREHTGTPAPPTSGDSSGNTTPSTTAGDTTAGDTTAGDTTAGDTTAGEMHPNGLGRNEEGQSADGQTPFTPPENQPPSDGRAFEDRDSETGEGHSGDRDSATKDPTGRKPNPNKKGRDSKAPPEPPSPEEIRAFLSGVHELPVLLDHPPKSMLDRMLLRTAMDVIQAQRITPILSDSDSAPAALRIALRGEDKNGIFRLTMHAALDCRFSQDDTFTVLERAGSVGQATRQVLAKQNVSTVLRRNVERFFEQFGKDLHQLLSGE